MSINNVVHWHPTKASWCNYAAKPHMLKRLTHRQNSNGNFELYDASIDKVILTATINLEHYLRGRPH